MHFCADTRHRFLRRALCLAIAFSCFEMGPVFAFQFQGSSAAQAPGTGFRPLAANSAADEVPQLRGLAPDSASPPAGSLDSLRSEAQQTEGALFMDADKVFVKPPVLSALIQLNARLSPYGLDSERQRSVALKDVLTAALDNNLDIKISAAGMEADKWKYFSSLGGFLPTLSNGLNYQTIGGKYASPFGLLTSVSSPDLTIPCVATWNFFQGGSIIYGALQKKHNYRAAQYSLKGTVNDILLDAASLYYQLALNDVLLQIRIKAVETAKALLLRNEDRFANGAATKLDVLQAKTQVARDRQALVNQQIARRQAAIKLATALNLDTAVDLSIQDRLVSKVRLIDENLSIGDLLQVAVDHRPELKKYEQLRLAAKDAIKVAFAPLLPQVFGTAIAATTGARVSGGAATGQSTAAAGAFGAGAFSTSTAASTGLSRRDKRFSLAEVFSLGIGVQWTLGGLGTTQAAQVKVAKWEARKAQLEFARELTKVYEEVRDSYLDVIDAENLINETTDAVNSARQQLEVATIRLEEGVGTDLDAINAQRDYTQALIDKASAIIKFDVAQAKLLRSMGRISADTLCAVRPLGKEQL